MVEGENLLIMGAGLYQVPLITRANELGYTTWVVSPPGFPGVATAGHHIEADVRDFDEIRRGIGQVPFSGVATAGADAGVETLARLCALFGTPGPTVQAAQHSSNKAKMKHAFCENGTPTADFRVVYELEHAVAAAASIGFPCVLKAVSLSGSRGIFIVSDERELRDSWPLAVDACSSEEFVLEQFLSGEEFGAFCLVDSRGNVSELVAFEDQVTYSGSTNIPTGHSLPCREEIAHFEEVATVAKLAVEAVGATSCAMNFDFISVDGKVSVIEVGLRSGATGIPELINYYYGADVYGAIIDLATGRQPRRVVDAPTVSSASAGFYLLYAEADGRLLDYPASEGGSDLSNQPLYYGLDCAVGEPVKALRNGSNRVGEFMAIAEDQDKLGALAYAIQRDFQGSIQSL